MSEEHRRFFLLLPPFGARAACLSIAALSVVLSVVLSANTADAQESPRCEIYEVLRDGRCAIDPQKSTPALLDLLSRRHAESEAGAVLVTVRMLLDAGANPNARRVDGASPLGLAVIGGLPQAVSVLLTAKADPYGGVGSGAGEYNAMQFVAASLAFSRGLAVMRGFIAGLDAAGISNYDWNRTASANTLLSYVRPLDLLAMRTTDASGPAAEMAALLYERGGECRNTANSVRPACNIQAGFVALTSPVETKLGGILTVTARDFGGDVFSLRLPDAMQVADFESGGWTLSVISDSPARIILSRVRLPQSGDLNAVFNITMVNADGRDVRLFHVIAPLCLGDFNEFPRDGACVAERRAASEGLLKLLDLGGSDDAYQADDPGAFAVSVLALLEKGADPSHAREADGASPLGLAAYHGLPEVVSILLTAGAEPSGGAGMNEQGRAYNAAHAIVLRARSRPYERALETLRHFIAGQRAAPNASDYDWNNPSVPGRDSVRTYPLSRLSSYESDRFSPPQYYEMLALIYERGGRCADSSFGAPSGCRVPAENIAPLPVGATVGVILTLTARDALGDVFSMPLPSAARLATLRSSGWTLSAESDASPARITLARIRPPQSGDRDAVFTITMMSANGQASREFRASVDLCPPFDSPGDGMCQGGADKNSDALLTLLNRPYAESDAEAVLASVRLLLKHGANPNTMRADGAGPLGLAAHYGFPQVISVLLTAGADPYGRTGAAGGNINVLALQAVARQSPGFPLSRRLAALRHFIGGLHVAAFSNYDWNRPALAGDAGDAGRSPMDLLLINVAGLDAQGEDITNGAEALALLHERGGQCAGGANASELCRAPVENVLHPHAVESAVGDILTLFARDFGGAVFNMRLPDDAKLAALQNFGWTLSAESTPPPARVILSRARTPQSGDENAAFTVTMTDSGGRAAREFRASITLCGGAYESPGDGACESDAEKSSPVLLSLLHLDADRRTYDSVDPGAILASVRLLLDHAANPSTMSAEGSTPLGLAAFHGFPQVISVLLTAGADARGQVAVPRSGRAAQTVFAGQAIASGRRTPAQSARALEATRHFIDGLRAAGFVYYDWNRTHGDGSISGKRPMDFLADAFTAADLEKWPDIAALIYERGGRCGDADNIGDPACGVPLEVVSAATLAHGFFPEVLQITARDFGGTVFSMPPPDDAKVAEMEKSGWDIWAESAAPQRVLLRRRRAPQTGDMAAVFTVTMTDAENRPARAFRASIGVCTEPLVPGVHGCADAEEATRLLLTLIDRSGPGRSYDESDPAAVLASVLFLLGNGADPSREYFDTARPLALAAYYGFPKIVSVLLTAGANPDSRTGSTGANAHAVQVAAYMDPNNPIPAARRLELVRHFIGGLAGRKEPYDFDYNWVPLPNRPGGVGARAIDFLSDTASALPAGGDDRDSILEAMALLYERGGRCEFSANTRLGCRLPIESVGVARPVEDFVGGVLTVAARDLGEVFSVPLPHAAKVDALEGAGWTLVVAPRTSEFPARIILARARPPQAGDGDAVFTITMLTGDNPPEPVREFRVSAALCQTGDVPSEGECLHSRDTASFLLLTLLSQNYDDADPGAVLSSVLLLLERDASLNALRPDAPSPIGLAAYYGFPKVVSLLLTAKADANGRTGAALGNHPALLAVAMDASVVPSARRLELVRHFIGGLHQAGVDDYEYNPPSSRPLSALVESVRRAVQRGEDASDLLEALALIYERGGRCEDGNADALCGIPIETPPPPLPPDSAVTAVLTIFARDFAGEVFSMPFPSIDKLTELQNSGWMLDAGPADNPPAHVILSRDRPPRRGDMDAAFTVTMLRFDGTPARAFRVSAAICDDSFLAFPSRDECADNTVWTSSLLLSLLGRSDIASLDSAAVLSSVLLLLENGADPSEARGDGATALWLAVSGGLPIIASVLLTAGADPYKAGGGDVSQRMNPAQLIVGYADSRLSLGTDLLRHFIGGLRRANVDYDWNRVGGTADPADDSPLDILAARIASAYETLPGHFEMAHLIWEHGGRCSRLPADPRFYNLCRLPVENVAIPPVGNYVGELITIHARDKLGAVFSMPPPRFSEVRALRNSGWALVAASQSNGIPARVILARVRGMRDGDLDAIFTVTMQNAAGQSAREFRINAPFCERQYDGAGDGECVNDPKKYSFELLNLLDERAPGSGREYSVANAENPDGVLMSVLFLLASRADPSVARVADGATPLGLAAFYGFPEVVSVLLTAGANPYGGAGRRARGAYNAAQAMLSGEGAPLDSRAMETLRHFINGLRMRPADADDYDWNRAPDAVPPLEFLSTLRGDIPTRMAALIYERGGRCGAGADGDGCRTPAEDFFPSPPGETTGAILTITALDAFGDRFSMPLPAAVKLATLENSGWTLSAVPADEAFPARVILTRVRLPRPLDADAVFTITMMSAAGLPAREFRASTAVCGGRLDVPGGGRCIARSEIISPALLSLLRDSHPSAAYVAGTAISTEAEILASVRALLELGADPGFVDANNWSSPLGLAAHKNYPNIVSALLAAGANPYGGAGIISSSTTGYANALQAIADSYGGRESFGVHGLFPLRATVLRHFIAGLHAGGHSDYDWNSGRIDAPSAPPVSIAAGPLDLLAGHVSHLLSPPGYVEMAALLYERGARCENSANAAKAACQTPIENIRPPPAEEKTGDILTLVARDFGGAVFSMQSPDAAKRASMARSGWTLSAIPADDESAARIILARAHPVRPGDMGAEFTVTMFDARQRPAREFRVLAEVCPENFGDADYGRCASVAQQATEELLELTNRQYIQADAEAALRRTRLLVKHKANVNAARPGATPLGQAALRGHAKIVSVLLTSGAFPSQAVVLPASGTKYGARLMTPAQAAVYAPGTPITRRLTVLRHFIGGMRAARISNYDWNRIVDSQLSVAPLDLASELAADNPATGEIAALIWERGGRCKSASNDFCRRPLELRAVPPPPDGFIGPVATLTARDFAGMVFSLPLPPPTALDKLTHTGWTLAAESGPPARLILSRTRPAQIGELDAVFSVTMRGDIQPDARLFLVRATLNVNPMVTIRFAAQGAGELRVRFPSSAGFIPAAPMVVFAGNTVSVSARPHLGLHVSQWSGSCASAPAGADDAERQCVFITPHGVTNLTLSVFFAPGRLPAGIPASGDVPAGDGLPRAMQDESEAILRRACEAFGGNARRRNYVVGTSGQSTTRNPALACHGLHSRTPDQGCSFESALAEQANGDALRCVPVFNHYRDCNAMNRTVADANTCGAACPAGFVARGNDCHRTGDQCELSPPSCPFATSCADSRPLVEDSDAELCRCGGQLDGAPGGCWNESATAELITLLLRDGRSSEVAASEVRARLQRGANPNAADADGSAALALAAQNFHHNAVSVLLVAGADPNGRMNDKYSDFAVLHNVAFYANNQLMLEVLRGFIGGLRAAGKADSFDGWNATGVFESDFSKLNGTGTPLEVLNAQHANASAPATREIHSLLWEWGARCRSETADLCRIPADNIAVALTDYAHMGPALTVTLRSPARTPLAYEWTDGEAEMILNGWAFSINRAPEPDEAVFSRARPSRVGDIPSVSLRASLRNADGTARAYNITLRMIVNDPRPLFYSAEGGGQLTAFSNGRAIPSGITLRPGLDNALFSAPESTLSAGQRLTFRAVADHGHYVAGWTDNCATSPTGGHTAQSECVLTWGEDDFLLIQAIFQGGRIASGISLTGDIPGGTLNEARGDNCVWLGGKSGFAPQFEWSVHSGLRVCDFGEGHCHASNTKANETPYRSSDCAAAFPIVRDCNLQNRPAADTLMDCAAECPPGLWARGTRCHFTGDQCAGADAPVCGQLAQCRDDNHARNDTDADLCVCRDEVRDNFLITDRGTLCVHIPASQVLESAADKYIGPCETPAIGDDGNPLLCGPAHADILTYLGIGADPNYYHTTYGFLLARAALSGQAQAVSILITAGADPNGWLSNNSSIPNHPSEKAGRSGSRQRQNVLHVFSEHLDAVNNRLDVAENILRRFIGALDSAGRLRAFDGWNLEAVVPENWTDRTPLGFFNRRAVERLSLAAESNLSAAESAALENRLSYIAETMTRYGARCLPGTDLTDDANRYCRLNYSSTALQIDSLDRLRAAVRRNDIDGARAAYRGLVVQNELRDRDRVPLVIVAATLGYGEMVSVLITLGASANARHDGRYVPHFSAENAASLPAATVFNVLRHFDDAASLTGESYKWNSEGGAGRLLAIEYLRDAHNRAPDDDERAMFVEIGEWMHEEKGERCRPARLNPPAQKYNPVCIGSAAVSLAALAAMSVSQPTAAEMRSAIQAVRDAGRDPLTAGHAAHGHLLPLAAMRGNAAAVSVLITLGHPPESRSRESSTRSPAALHRIAHQAAARPDAMLAVLRAFIGGLRETGRLYLFNEWSALTDDLPPPGIPHGGTPMDIVLRVGGVDGEVWRILYEAGSICRVGGVTNAELCARKPVEIVMRMGPPTAGPALTLAGFDFRGEPYVIPPESAAEAEFHSRLAFNGWAARARATPGRFELLRTRGRRTSDSAAMLTVTAQLTQRRGLAKIWQVEARLPDAASERFARAFQSPQHGGTLFIASPAVDHVFPIGAAVTFLARPGATWRVERWTGTGGASSCPRGRESIERMCALTIPADSDLIVTAHFAPRHALFFDPPVSARRVEADGGAAVKSGEVFDAGTTLVFSANAPNGGRALGWRKDGAPFPACDGADECQMTVSADGLWAAADYGVSVRYAHLPADGSGGTLTVFSLSSGGTAPLDSVITFAALPAAGWHAAMWSGDASSCPPSPRAGAAECERLADAAVFATVTFAESRAVSFSPPIFARQSGDGGGREKTKVESGNVVVDGAEIEFFVDSENYNASGWLLNDEVVAECERANACEITAAGEDMRVGAMFEGILRTIYYGQFPASGRGGTVTSELKNGGQLAHDAAVTFTATPADGWHVLNWLGDNGECRGIGALGSPSESGAARIKTCAQSARFEMSVAAVFVEIKSPDDRQIVDAGHVRDYCLHAESAPAGTENRRGELLDAAGEKVGDYCVIGLRRVSDGAGGHLYSPLKSCHALDDADYEGPLTFARADETQLPPLESPAHCDRVLACAAQKMLDGDGNYFTEDDCAPPDQCAPQSNPCGANALCADPDAENFNPARDLCRCDRYEGYVGDGLTCELLASPLAAVDFSHFPADGSGGTLTVFGLDEGGFANRQSTVTFTALPAEGWHAAAWGGDADACRPIVPRAGAVECEVMANSDLSAAVTFAASRTISISPPVSARRTAKDGGAEVESGDIFADGVTIEFSTQAADNMRVRGWRLNGAEVEKCALTNFCALATDGESMHMLAEFEPVPRTVYYAQSPADGRGGTVTVAGLKSGETVPHGAPVTFTAIPADGWIVLDWRGDDDACRGRSALGAPSETGADREKICVRPAVVGVSVAAIFERIKIHGARIVDAAHVRQYCEHADSVPAGTENRRGDLLRGEGGEKIGDYCIVGLALNAGGVYSSLKSCYALDDADFDDQPFFADANETGLSNFDIIPDHCDLVLACPAAGMADGDGNYFTEDDCFTTDQCAPESDPCDANAQCADTDLLNPNPAWEICECDENYRGDGRTCAPVIVTIFHAAFPADGSGGTLTANVRNGGQTIINAMLTFSATPAERFYVSGWSDSQCGAVGRARAPGEMKECELPARAGAFITVTFAAARKVEFDESVSASIDDEALGSGDFAADGRAVTFSARTPEGYAVSGWTNNGAAVGDCESNSICDIAADADLSVAASFARARRTVSYSSAPVGGGALTVTGIADGDAVYHGATVTFAAVPANNFYVHSWTGGGAQCAGAQCILTATIALFVTVHFGRDECGLAECGANMECRDANHLTADAPADLCSCAPNYALVGGACVASQYAVSRPSATVSFEGVVSLSWNAPEEGVSGYIVSRRALPSDAFVSLTVVSEPHYLDADAPAGSTVRYKVQAEVSGIDAPESEESLSAVIPTVKHPRRVAYSQTPSGGEGGTLTATGAGFSGDFVRAGTTVTFTAIPSESHYVSNWNDSECDDVGQAGAPGAEKKCALTVEADVFVTVAFSPARLVMFDGALASLDGESIDNGDYVADGALVTFSALVPADDFYVHSWTGSGAECSGGQCVLTATMALFVTVHFGRDQCASMECGANTECRDENHLTADDAANLCSCAPDYTLVEGGGCQATQYATGRPSAAVFENGIVSLSWTAPAEPVSGYVILRQTVASGIYASLTVAADLSYVDEDAPPGATVRYKIQAEVAGVNTPESQESPALTIPPAADCRAMNRAPGSRPQFCDRGCMILEGAQFMELEPGGKCLHWLRDDFGGMSQADVCLALRRKNDQILEGVEQRVCSGIDKIDTFCILDSTFALPCRGLLKHVLQCNLAYNRPAEDMFFCGPKCPPGQNAVGAECRE